jgi:hypothetical protein
MRARARIKEAAAMKKRPMKRPYVIARRCDCVTPNTCEHPWWLRVKVGHDKRQRINITEMFPDEAVDAAAARAKDWARKGSIKDGHLIAARAADMRPTFGFVADRYVAAHPARPHYYLTELRSIEVLPANTKLEDKPVDEVTTADIKFAVEVWRGRKRTRAGAKRGAVAERHLKQAARHMFNWAIEEGYAKCTPFKSLQGVSLIHIKVTKARKRRLEEGEESRILAVADPYIRDFFVAMLETGCRPGELRTLQWSELREDHFVCSRPRRRITMSARCPSSRRCPPFSTGVRLVQMGPSCHREPTCSATRRARC